MVPAQGMKPVAWAVYDRKFGGSKSLHEAVGRLVNEGTKG